MAKKLASETQPVKDSDSGKLQDYEIDDAMRTLLKAEEIKQDDKLMKAVQGRLGKQQKAIRSIADLRAKKQELDAEPDGDE